MATSANSSSIGEEDIVSLAWCRMQSGPGWTDLDVSHIILPAWSESSGFCRIYGPLVLPYLVGMIVLGVEVIGDVTATAEVSHIETAGPKHRRRIKGGLLADGFNCLLAACAMTLPVTTFAQNNGVSLF